MTKTNFDKLVRWDADYYKTLTEDDCLVCLTEREVYLVGQILDMLRWKNTRWIGNLVGLDFDLIASNLEYKLSERMTCKDVSTLLQKIIQLEKRIDYVFNETVINEGDTPFSPDTTVIDDVFTPEEMQTGDMAVEADTCDSAGKDQIYGSVNQVVRYIVGLNTDLLQQFEQSVGNLAEQAETLLGAFPVTDFLAADDVSKYVAFLTQELQEEYEATVDENLIQETICDIFCIAVANNCKLTMWDIYNYFGSKIDPTFTNAALTYANLVNFAFTGTFTGDMYFHYLCYFQLASAAFNGAVTGDGLEAYERQIAAGFNSPDNDWTIHCIDCPSMYRLFTVNFALGMNEFDFLVAPGGSACPGVTLGTLTSGRVKGVTCGAQNTIGITMPLETNWRIRGVKLYLERENGITNGTYDYETVTMIRAAGNVNFQQGGFRENGVIERCVMMTASPFYRTDGTALEVRLGVFYDADPVSAIYLDKIEVLFEMNYAPDRAVISYDGNFCD